MSLNKPQKISNYNQETGAKALRNMQRSDHFTSESFFIACAVTRVTLSPADWKSSVGIYNMYKEVIHHDMHTYK